MKVYSPLLGRTVRWAREELVESIVDLASSIGVCPEFVSAFEEGNISVDEQFCAQCAEHFGLSLPELVDLALGDMSVLVCASDGEGSIQQNEAMRAEHCESRFAVC